ncbi:hypothetical protein [Gluconobacter wancherniae]|uniref:hypothetical protein n=1 Tax=Gluconobacter wancherniae TaxID=1307955 RepID=UPI002012D1C0|nr:hypothetical protein [Gluconobacter wancherniae]
MSTVDLHHNAPDILDLDDILRSQSADFFLPHSRIGRDADNQTKSGLTDRLERPWIFDERDQVIV